MVQIKKLTNKFGEVLEVMKTGKVMHTESLKIPQKCISLKMVCCLHIYSNEGSKLTYRTVNLAIKTKTALKQSYRN